MKTERNKKDLEIRLNELRKKVIKLINEGIAENRINPVERIWSRNTHFFDEDENGLTWRGKSGEDFAKESFTGRDIDYIEEEIKQTSEYKNVNSILTQTVKGRFSSETILKYFVWEFIFAFFETKKAGNKVYFRAIQKYIDDEALNYFADVALIGVIAPHSSIKFKIGRKSFHLRRITREDFPSEISNWEDNRKDWFEEEKISSILRIEIPIKDNESVSDLLQKTTGLSITILHLFKVGSVSSSYIQHDTEAFWDRLWKGRSEKTVKPSILEKALIKSDEVKIFKTFWIKIKDFLPEEGFRDYNKQTNSIEIAYQRYSDALLAYRMVAVERRIADAVMGLESLFLTGDEKEVLGFRLRTRMAKVLGLLGYNPYAVRTVTNNAYGVRSAFVHGDKIGKELERTIGKKYNDIKELLRLTLEELRIAIVIFLVIQKKMSKENFIKLIDETFIDERKTKELINLLSEIKNILVLPERETFEKIVSSNN
jgi:hypothetical protein